MERLSERVRDLFWAFDRPVVSADLARDVQELQDMIGDQGQRFRACPVALSYAWFPLDPRRDHGRVLMSDYGVDSGPPEVGAEFRDEVTALCDIIEDDAPAGLPEQRIERDLAKRAHALQNWNRLGVPLRADRDATVFHIVAPRDLMGSPLISSMSLRTFLPLVAEKSALDAFRIAQLEAQVGLWKVLSIVCAVGLLIAFF